MEKKKRRYEISSKVRIPDMDDIQRAASDFNEARLSEEQKNDFISRNAKHVVSAGEEKYNPMLNSMNKEMLQLAMAVASEESEKKEAQTEAAEIIEQEETLDETSEEVSGVQQIVTDENNAARDVLPEDESLF